MNTNIAVGDEFFIHIPFKMKGETLFCLRRGVVTKSDEKQFLLENTQNGEVLKFGYPPVDGYYMGRTKGRSVSSYQAQRATEDLRAEYEQQRNRTTARNAMLDAVENVHEVLKYWDAIGRGDHDGHINEIALFMAAIAISAKDLVELIEAPNRENLNS